MFCGKSEDDKELNFISNLSSLSNNLLESISSSNNSEVNKNKKSKKAKDIMSSVMMTGWRSRIDPGD